MIRSCRVPPVGGVAVSPDAEGFRVGRRRSRLEAGKSGAAVVATCVGSAAAAWKEAGASASRNGCDRLAGTRSRRDLTSFEHSLE